MNKVIFLFCFNVGKKGNITCDRISCMYVEFDLGWLEWMVSHVSPNLEIEDDIHTIHAYFHIMVMLDCSYIISMDDTHVGHHQ